MAKASTNDFHPQNTATQLLAKIGSGSADADFARAVHLAVERASQVGKKAKVVLTVEVDPRDETGSLIIRADVVAKLPKLPAPASQMHVGQEGELLTQQEYIFGGGRSEAKQQPIAPPASSASGRHPVVAPPAPAPIANAPKPGPVVGKDAAAGPT